MSFKAPKLAALLFCFALCLSNNYLHGQTYNFSFKKKKGIFFSSLAVWSGIKTYDVLRAEEFLDDYEDIDPDLLWRLDRRSLNRNSKSADHLSDVTLYSAIALPFITVLLNHKTKPEAWDIALMGVTGYFIENSINQFFKIAAERPRPYIYQQAEAILNQKISKNSLKSFYSGHASSAAYFSFFAAKVYADTHPHSKFRPLVWAGAAVLTGTTGYLRYRAGKHFYTDVITGWIMGGLMGILVPEIHKSKTTDVSITPRHLLITFKL